MAQRSGRLGRKAGRAAAEPALGQMPAAACCNNVARLELKGNMHMAQLVPGALRCARQGRRDSSILAGTLDVSVCRHALLTVHFSPSGPMVALAAQPAARQPASLFRASRRPVQCVATADSAPHGLRNASAKLAGVLAAAVVLAAPPALAAPRPAAPPLPPLQEVLDLPPSDTVYELNGESLFNPMAYTGRWYEVRRWPCPASARSAGARSVGAGTKGLQGPWARA